MNAFYVELDRPGERRGYGIRLRLQGRTVLVVLELAPDGIAAIQNRAAPPEQQLLVGDIIVGVNQTHGDAIDMINELQIASFVTIELRRP